jgi:hypothetical protein
MRVSVVYPPNRVANKTHSIFLAGTIDMGNSIDWQQHSIDTIESFDIEGELTVYNPRRADWDSSWKQEITDPQFNEQVSWELDMLEQADIIVLYFQKDSSSPISMLELGLFSKHKKMLICCEEGFWRKGNIDIVCQRNEFPMYTELDNMLIDLKERIKNLPL